MSFISGPKGINQAAYNTIQIGDFVSSAGIYTKPGVVTEKKPDGTVVIDTSPETIDLYHRYANTTGLTLDEKSQFNDIMGDILDDSNSPVDRINELQKQIDGLKTNPMNRKVVTTLKLQQVIMIRQAGDLPRVYTTKFDKIGGNSANLQEGNSTGGRE